MLLQLLFLLATAGHAFVDTRSWVGAAYAPAAAPGDMWLGSPFFEAYLPNIDRELGAAARHLKTTAIRVFLHTTVYESPASNLLRNVNTFLDVAASHNIGVGLVLFDACWNTANASATEECLPTAGRHNGCWYESPQAADMTTLDRFLPYVTDVVSTFGNDTRVLWLEIYNEPRAPNADFVFALRDAAYEWTRSMSPANPIISCWDDNVDTEVVDHHDYTPNFASEWRPAVYANVSKGAIITEAGSRWYQPPFVGDYGSTLLVINFLTALSSLEKSGAVPFVPGAMISWELYAGNSHTRWHWGSPDGAAEPAIAWCGNLFPDGTPVSYTEAGAIRRYVTGVDEFLFFNKFLPSPPSLLDGDAFLSVRAGATWEAALNVNDALFEAAVWVEEGGVISLIIRAGAVPPHIRKASSVERVRDGESRDPPTKRAAHGAAVTLPTPRTPQSETCTLGPLLNNTDACAGGPPGYRDLDVAHAPDPRSACAAACCAWSDCTAWVMRQLHGTDENCTDTLCCWLKPDCAPSQTSPVDGATAQFVAAPPGPPLPVGIRGYALTLNTTGESLTASRCDDAGSCSTLGTFNTSALAAGIIRGAWNMLRVVAQTDNGSGELRVAVYFNPTVPETGFVGIPAIDAKTVPVAPPPRLVFVDPQPLPAGGIVIGAGVADARVDYVSALPVSVFQT
jgi:hypothetical protein